MAVEERVRHQTYVSGEDLTARMYRFGRPMPLADGTLGVATATGSSDCLGVIYGKEEIGRATTVCVEGAPKVEYGGTITAGDEVGSDSVGRAIRLTAGGSGGTRFGIAKVSGVVGHIGQIDLTRLQLAF